MNINSLYTQNIFSEKFEGCNTDRFATESDKIKVKPSDKDITLVLTNSFYEKNIEKVRGELSLQIIVDVDGSSCLISIDNKTNIKSENLELKNIIDNYLVWQKPTEKTSVMISLIFRRKKITKKRIGISGKKGLHEISN